jgi:glycosyltransferase involved in cell wall biosynthesis
MLFLPNGIGSHLLEVLEIGPMNVRVKIKVCHLSSAHVRMDTRILNKQCFSLLKEGYDVTLVVADGQADEDLLGIKIVDVGKVPGRLDRILKTTKKVFTKAIELDADIYHFHDPELIPCGLKLKRMGKKVIFDSHEDVPKQMLSKPYLTPLVLRAISRIIAVYEGYAGRRIDAVVTATPYIRDKFLRLGARSVDINNFPIQSEFDLGGPWDNKENEICYVGGISEQRGIKEIVTACSLAKTRVRLNLAGSFSSNELRKELIADDSWQCVNELGEVGRSGVKDVLFRSRVGLVTLHPIINYLDALPIKMFEYMSAGIPVIASNFPLWRSIIEETGCGLCVNPLDPLEIAEAIDTLIEHPDMAEEMGQNGRIAVAEKYNWEMEEKKLVSLYRSIV